MFFKNIFLKFSNYKKIKKDLWKLLFYFVKEVTKIFFINSFKNRLQCEENHLYINITFKNIYVRQNHHQTILIRHINLGHIVERREISFEFLILPYFESLMGASGNSNNDEIIVQLIWIITSKRGLNNKYSLIQFN